MQQPDSLAQCLVETCPALLQSFMQNVVAFPLNLHFAVGLSAMVTKPT